MRAAAALLVLALGACGGQKPADPLLELGGRVYAERCAACHGERREGRRTAPALGDAREHWDRECLARYLRDPGPFLENDPRLLHVAGRYVGRMPGFPSLPDEELAAVVRFLLEVPAGERSAATPSGGR